MNRTVGLLAFGLLAGCGPALRPSVTVSELPRVIAAEPPPAGPTELVAAVAPDDLAPPPSARSGPVTARWSDVHATPGCFFFSGPLALGRDTHLGDAGRYATQGAQVSLWLGPDAEFRGEFTRERASLRRAGRYDYAGPWTTEETLEGVVAAPGVFEGEYQYKECEASHPDQCPGRCTIRARVTLRW